MGRVVSITTGVYKLSDLGDKRPVGHPRAIDRTPNGKAVLAVRQVWVEFVSRALWVITALRDKNCSYGERGVTIALYASQYREVNVSEPDVHLNMEIWDDAVIQIPQNADHKHRAHTQKVFDWYGITPESKIRTD